MRRPLITGAATALLAALPLCHEAGAAPGPIPNANVLLITVDTLRADRLGSYGFGLDATPEIDALAARGVLFERAIAGASSTAPAHAAIMTRSPVETRAGVTLQVAPDE